MKINLSPQRRDDKLTVEVNGDRIRINGELLNFNTVPEGGRIALKDIPCEWIASDIVRKDGEIVLTLVLPHGPNPSQFVAFPEAISITEDGPVSLPEDKHEEEVENVDTE